MVLVSRISKKFLHHSTIKRQTSQFKNGWRIWKDLSPNILVAKKHIQMFNITGNTSLNHNEISLHSHWWLPKTAMDVAREWQNQSPHLTNLMVVRLHIGEDILKTSLSVPQSLNTRVTTWPAILLKIKIIQVPISCWMDKNVGEPYSGLFSGKGKERTHSTCSPWRQCATWKKAVLNDHVL
jgi:hypothetical protein